MINPKNKWRRYKTPLGICINEKCETVISKYLIPNYQGQIQLIFTSPPFPLNRAKKYGNLMGDEYKKWLCDVVKSMLPLPSLSQKYKDISILNNRSSIKGKKYDSILYAPADNPFEVYNFLEKNYADEPSICISPLATKPVALGVCLFALNYEKVRIVYPISDIYSSHVTNQVTKTLVYEISLTQ